MNYINKIIISLFALLVFAGCSSSANTNDGLNGSIKIDGSSTVAPITEAVIEDFKIDNPGVNITMGISGTGGGFKKFITGETQISNASRHIKEAEENTARENNVNYREIQIGIDALSVVTNTENDWATDLSVDQLQKIWTKGNEGIKWSDIDPSWPDEEIKLYGPGLDSGTYDYFNEVIIGEGNEMRTDFTASEDDNVLVTGVIGDKNAMSFFGYVYYVENMDNLNAIKVNGVAPTIEAVQGGLYAPLSRPLFIYVNYDEFTNNIPFKVFVEFYLENVEAIVTEIGYVALHDDELQAQKDLLK